MSARCCHCHRTSTITLVYNGVAYALCSGCHERVALTLAGLRRFGATLAAYLSLPLG